MRHLEWTLKADIRALNHRVTNVGIDIAEVDRVLKNEHQEYLERRRKIKSDIKNKTEQLHALIAGVGAKVTRLQQTCKS